MTSHHEFKAVPPRPNQDQRDIEDVPTTALQQADGFSEEVEPQTASGHSGEPPNDPPVVIVSSPAPDAPISDQERAEMLAYLRHYDLVPKIVEIKAELLDTLIRLTRAQDLDGLSVEFTKLQTEYAVPHPSPLDGRQVFDPPTDPPLPGRGFYTGGDGGGL